MADEVKDQVASELGRLGGIKTAERGPEYYAEIQAKRQTRGGGRPKNPPEATHVGEIKIGDLTIPCAVLADGRRVLSQRGVGKALGRGRGGQDWKRQDTAGGGQLPFFLMAKNLKPFILDDLRVVVSDPVIYRDKRAGGRPAHGLEATVLPQICDVWLRARDAGALSAAQIPLAMRADILMRGLAHTGIIALVDEATGYQDVRDRKALQQILDQYIGKELAKWAKRFPDEFYEQMFRLRGWIYNPDSSKRPMAMAKMTIDLVFDRIGPGLTKELKEREMERRRTEGNGRRHLHRWLTPEIGHPALAHHLSGLTFLGKSFEDGQWEAFHRAVDRVAPKYNRTLLLPFPDQDMRGDGTLEAPQP